MMADSPHFPGLQPLNSRETSACQEQAQRFWHDPALYGVVMISVLLIAFQVAVILLKPSWAIPVTDWLRTVLAWAAWLVVLLISQWLRQSHRVLARSWWVGSLALLFHAVARTIWAVDDQIITPGYVPFPSLPDLFFFLQYPFFFLAIILHPSERSWESRIKLFLDGLLVMGAATALSWYFMLAPLYMEGRESALTKLVKLSYPIWDLVILFGLTMIFIFRRCQIERIVASLLMAAIICLLVADSWVVWLLPSGGYTAGSVPDLFRSIFYLLLPLAGLVRFRLSQRLPSAQREQRARMHFDMQDLKEVVRFLFPIVVALLVCGVIAGRAIIAPFRPIHPIFTILIIAGLLTLVIVRQALTILENARLRREREVARTNELVVRETNRQMETFLGMASHELKTPLTSIIMGLQLIQRRITRPMRQAPDPAHEGSSFMTSQGALELALQQADRMDHLVNDLLNISRINSGRLGLTLKPVDLCDIVVEAVEEQRQLAPERTIILHLPVGKPVLVSVDAERIRQVVTNYLTNALKYSLEERLVEVGVEMEQPLARLWVRDQGPGIPPDEQERIWERFHRAANIEIQSGSGIGLGLGLHISKTIVELHHGQVGVQSDPGSGSTFWFTIPLATPEEESPDKANEDWCRTNTTIDHYEDSTSTST